MSAEVQFNRVWFDRKRNKMHHWYTINGTKFHDTEDYLYRYYIHDESGKSEWKDTFGNPVKQCFSDNKYALKDLVDTLRPNIHEADLIEDIVFLHDKYEKVNLTLNMDNINICYFDIEIATENEFPDEKNVKYPVALITAYFTKSNRLVSFGLKEFTNKFENLEYHHIPDEKRLLEKFIEVFRKESVDIVSGWNIDGYDIPYIVNRAEKLGIDKTLSPVNEYYKNKFGDIEICGISSLDYLKLYRDKFEFDTKDSYKLDDVCQAELGEGKHDFGTDTFRTIWRNNWNGFVKYNIQDVLLIKRFEEKKKYIELSVNIAFQSLIPFHRVFSTISMHTGFILSYLHKNKMVMPVRTKETEKRVIPGGYVEAQDGLHKWVVSFDVESLYPHLIMQYNIGHETLLKDINYSGEIQRTPLSEYKNWETADGKAKWGGISYKKDNPSVISVIVKQIFDERKKFKTLQNLCKKTKNLTTGLDKLSEADKKLVDIIRKESGNAEYYDKQQHIRKIMINSLYGALGNEYFNLYNQNNAACITLSGQHLIRYIADCFNDYFKKTFELEKNVIVLVDTDSNYLTLDELIQKRGLEFKTNKEASEYILNFIDKEVNPFIKKMIGAYAKFYDAPNIINFRHEKIIKSMLITGKKHYAMNIICDEGKIYEEPKFKVMGIETKKTNTSDFLRNVGTNILKKILEGTSKEEVSTYYRQIYRDFKKAPIADIAVPGRVNDYDKYSISIPEAIKGGIKLLPKTPIRNSCAIFFNCFIKKFNLPYAPITNGTSIKYVYVNEENLFRCRAIAFTEEWSEIFDENFTVNYELQWSTCENIITKWFEVLNWGKPQIKMNTLASFGF